jgi:malonyl-CoA/methylmalonyl-CoA synthetase
LKDDDTIDLEVLRSWCKDRISHYKIPRRLLAVDELPRNAMGKVTKPDVLKLFENVDTSSPGQ